MADVVNRAPKALLHKSLLSRQPALDGLAWPPRGRAATVALLGRVEADLADLGVGEGEGAGEGAGEGEGVGKGAGVGVGEGEGDR